MRGVGLRTCGGGVVKIVKAKRDVKHRALLLFVFVELKNQHCITKRKEMILLLYSHAISLQNAFSAGQSRNKHDERAFGQVEVSD